MSAYGVGEEYVTESSIGVEPERTTEERGYYSTRTRQPEEIVPVGVEHSRTTNDNEDTNAAKFAIDLDYNTRSSTTAGSDNRSWLKITLPHISCISEVIEYENNGDVQYSWHCSESSCPCKQGTGNSCSIFSLSVTIQGTSPRYIPSDLSCKYGDTVTLERTDGKYFVVYEIAVVGKASFGGWLKQKKHVWFEYNWDRDFPLEVKTTSTIGSNDEIFFEVADKYNYHFARVVVRFSRNPIFYIHHCQRDTWLRKLPESRDNVRVWKFIKQGFESIKIECDRVLVGEYNFTSPSYSCINSGWMSSKVHYIKFNKYWDKTVGILVIPVDGEWSDYGDWSRCTATCGGGTQKRTRTCTNPAPARGGATCQGHGTERRICNTHPCPVNGGWSVYDDWSWCPVTCGGGTKTRKRTCTNPAPSNGGAQCRGHSFEEINCNTNPCPVDGGWSRYSEWGECDKSCNRRRYRSCDNPLPQHGGDYCKGLRGEEKKCDHLLMCPSTKMIVWGIVGTIAGVISIVILAWMYTKHQNYQCPWQQPPLARTSEQGTEPDNESTAVPSYRTDVPVTIPITSPVVIEPAPEPNNRPICPPVASAPPLLDSLEPSPPQYRDTVRVPNVPDIPVPSYEEVMANVNNYKLIK